MSAAVIFFVPGIARPAGSKTAVPIYKGKRGEPRVRVATRVVDSSGEPGKHWRANVAMAASAAMKGRPPFQGAVRLEVRFWRPRPNGHHGKRGLRPSAPAWPTTKPDSTKLIRALEDALTGIAWKDDAQIVDQVVSKRYADDAPPGAEVKITTLEP